MCNWNIIAVPPQYPTTIEIKGQPHPTGIPKFDPSFEAHMKGKEGKAQHTGLHTLNGLTEGEDYIIEKDEENAPKKVRALSCNQVYSAKVKLKAGQSKFGKIEWEKEFKLSTFFPDTMCLEHIREATVKAFLYYKGVKQHPIGHEAESAQIDLVAIGATKWAGRVRIRPGKQGQESTIWVGSLGTGESDNSKLYNSFPTFNENFARQE